MTLINLHQDQQEIIDNVRADLVGGSKSCLIQASTGAGKTYISAAIALSAYKKYKRILFIAPRRDLIKQTGLTFNKFDINHSYIAAGRKYNPNARVHVASLQTLVNRLDKVGDYDLVIVDEAHYGSGMVDKVVQHFKPKTTLLGLSATPWDMAGRGMAHQYDSMVCGKSTKWLIENKRLSEYRAFAPTHLDLSNIGIVGGDYNKKQLSEKMEADVLLMGDVVNHYKDHAMGQLGVTFCVRRKHSEMMAQAFRDNGVPAMHMDGDTPPDVRVKIAKAYARKEILQICNAELLTFGYDLASISGSDSCIQVMSDCQPTKSLSKQLQKDGRVLRYDGEVHKIFDHANNIDKHGLPCQDRDWTLEPRVKSKKRAKERAVPVKECSECRLCHSPAPTCPYCGFEYPIEERTIEQVDVELREIEIKQMKKKKRMEVGSARTIKDLTDIAQDRGYNRGWIYRMAKIKRISR